MEEKMIKVINKHINDMKINFAKTQQFDSLANAELNGMMKMLSVATGKNYYFCDGVVREK